jgi:uncharacterized protein YfcZ (UPF0381/DUF406 family)
MDLNRKPPARISTKEESTLFLKSYKYIKAYENIPSHIDFLNNGKHIKRIEMLRNAIKIPTSSSIGFIGCNFPEIGLHMVLSNLIRFVHFFDNDTNKINILNSLFLFDKDTLEDKIKYDNITNLNTNTPLFFDFIFCFEAERFIFYTQSFEDFFEKLKRATRKALIIEYSTSFKDDPQYSKKIFKASLSKNFTIVKKLEKNIYMALK